MIASLRRRHRVMFIGLVVIGAPMLAGSVLYRPSMDLGEPPEGLIPEAVAAGAGVVAPFSDLEAGFRVADGSWILEIHEPLTRPDVLAYWSPGAPSGAALPDDVYLLGPVSAARPNVYVPPNAAEGGGGVLILYSLGHQELVTSGALDGQGLEGKGGQP